MAATTSLDAIYELKVFWARNPIYSVKKDSTKNSFCSTNILNNFSLSAANYIREKVSQIWAFVFDYHVWDTIRGNIIKGDTFQTRVLVD